MLAKLQWGEGGGWAPARGGASAQLTGRDSQV